jgi:3-hydroxybutyryl-CoA dehydratase
MTCAMGDLIATYTIVAEPEAMKTWAKVLRDPNPIHLDPEVVRAKGLGDRVINQGPVNLAYITNALGAAFPSGTIELLDVRYLDNVFGGDTVEASGKITDITDADGLRRYGCDVWLAVRGRGLVLSGRAIVVQSL